MMPSLKSFYINGRESIDDPQGMSINDGHF